MDNKAPAEILSQGDEVVTGQIADTNAAWLAQQLQRLGFDIIRHTTVGDRLDHLVAQLHDISVRTDVCVCTGGLGPTVDDLTADAVAQAFDRPLELDPDALKQIEDYFARRGYPMPATNRKQAYLPRDAQRLDNRCGTAPGFMLRHGRCLFAFLPGVPAEMQAMFVQSVEPGLTERFRLAPDELVIFRTIGLGESTLQEMLDGLDLPKAVRLGFRAAVPENEVKLLFPAGFPLPERSSLIERAADRLGDALVSIEAKGMPGGNLAAVCGRLLEALDTTVAAAETGSAGQIAWQCRGQPQLIQSLVAADTGGLLRLLGIDPAIFPGDPEHCARLAAVRLRDASGSGYALVNLGEISEPASRPPDRPVSPVALGLAGPGFEQSRCITVAGFPDRQRQQVAALSLDLLRRALTERVGSPTKDGARC